MASLMENLLLVLEEQELKYEELLALSMKKTPVIIQGDITRLQEITEEEQIVVSKLNQLDKKREEFMFDIANVINKDVKTLKLKYLIEMLSGQPKEQERLAVVTDKLNSITKQMKRVNEQNSELLTDALDMVEYDLNLLRSMKAAPETANYDRGAFNMGKTLGNDVAGFDAKQ